MKESIEVNKYASSLDILPTILNLFNADYDSRLLMGKDILSDEEGLVMFNDRSWITSNGKYNATTKVFTPFKDNVKDTYVDEINTIVYNKFLMSKLILENDYYSKIIKKSS
jgi:phosphoglycerol transferase MdoB-like AlkP superfamily enzyme